jgi:hypothetical protein
LADSLLDYRRYLYASSQVSAELSPGPAIDLVWHTHQCNPTQYAADLSRNGMKFIDHMPCGEANPPDPQWTLNSKKAWKKLFGTKFGDTGRSGGKGEVRAAAVILQSNPRLLHHIARQPNPPPLIFLLTVCPSHRPLPRPGSFVKGFNVIDLNRQAHDRRAWRCVRQVSFETTHICFTDTSCFPFVSQYGRHNRSIAMYDGRSID